jgi:fructose-1,6-bisphosphatase
MINLRLPPTINDNTPISLSDALDQHQYFIENGTMVPRHTSLIYSRGVLFFFVDRRANIIRYNDMQPFNIARLPLSVSGFERLNDREVDYQDEITIRSDVYQLRSVVVAEVNRNAPERNLVVGSSTIIMIHADLTQQQFVNEYFLYDPMSVSDGNINPITGAYTSRTPVSQIYGNANSGGPPGESFNELARQRGIIFMYKLHKDDTKGDVVY